MNLTRHIKTEKDLYLFLKSTFPTADWERIENAVSSGIPDVNVCFPHPKGGQGTEVWLELKVEHALLRPAQRAWFYRAGRVGRRAFVLTYWPRHKRLHLFKNPLESMPMNGKWCVLGTLVKEIPLDEVDSLPLFLTK